MASRIEEELALLRGGFPTLEVSECAQWIKLPGYSVGWDRQSTDIAFQIPKGHPATPPYGFYVNEGIRLNGVKPNNYTEPSKLQPPFGGRWGLFSWRPQIWHPRADVLGGSNLLNWAEGFSKRFREGL